MIDNKPILELHDPEFAADRSGDKTTFNITQKYRFLGAAAKQD